MVSNSGLPMGGVGAPRNCGRSQAERQELSVRQSFDDGYLMKRHCLVSQRVGLSPGVPRRIVRLPPAFKQALIAVLAFAAVLARFVRKVTIPKKEHPNRRRSSHVPPSYSV